MNITIVSNYDYLSPSNTHSANGRKKKRMELMQKQQKDSESNIISHHLDSLHSLKALENNHQSI